MKLCKDCKHFRQEYIQCGRKEQVSPIDGNTFQVFQTAWSEREAWFFGCGKKGKYWEARDEISRPD